MVVTAETLLPTSRELRADARKNVEHIRSAAAELFRSRGFGVPLDQIAEAAGVSKGTIYHRFGNREALVASLIDELVGECVGHAIEAAGEAPDARTGLETYLRRIWWIQYDEPAANDVLIRARPESPSSRLVCERTSDFVASLLEEALRDGTVASDLTASDLDRLIAERGHALRAGERPSRDDFARHLEITLRGLRA